MTSSDVVDITAAPNFVTSTPLPYFLEVTHVPTALGFDEIAVAAFKRLLEKDVQRLSMALAEPGMTAAVTLVLREPHGLVVSEEVGNRVRYVNKVMTEAFFVDLDKRDVSFDLLCSTLNVCRTEVVSVVMFRGCKLTHLSEDTLQFEGSFTKDTDGDFYLAKNYLAARGVEPAPKDFV